MKRIPIMIIIFILTFSTHHLFSQTTWTFEDDQHIFTLHLDTLDCGGSTDDDCLSVTAIHIKNTLHPDKSQIIQTDVFTLNGFPDTGKIFIIEDINFDGYKDIRLISWVSTNLQTTYWYWVYNVSEQRFQRITDLDEIMNPEFNLNTKTIHSWWRDGFFAFGHALYKWDLNKIILIAQEEEVWGLDPKEGGVSTTIINRNGKFTTTEKNVSDYEIDFMHHLESCKLLHN
jgi:hypothetical protein